MEYKIGQIFEIDDVWYQFVEDNSDRCGSCVFSRVKGECANPDEDVKCAKLIREDGKSGHFVRLLPIGDVYEQGGATWQQYKCVEKPNTEDKRVYIAYTDSEVGLIVSIRLTSSNGIERKIGEIFEYNGEWYQCMECDSCGNCSLRATECGSGTKSELADEVFGQCSKVRRSDNKHAIFKKLEKVGGPLKINGRAYQGLISPYRFNNCSMCALRNISSKEVIPCYDDYVYIEIKQNKEDMKTVKISKDDLNFLVNKIRYGILPKHTTYDEITDEISNLFSVDDTKHSNSESIGKNLKPFSLEAAKSGKPVCTRDGRKARILCYDFKQNDEYPLLVAVENIYGKECPLLYSNDGICDNYKESNCELAMIPEKKEGWVNVSKFSTYASKEEALSHKTYDIIDTIKVSWEE